ncbi:MAG: DUF547 domain-containing protein [Desulfuromonadales bacterium]|nr:DUF547 domain-containing protein [Desulfuromonadales bacterium]
MKIFTTMGLVATSIAALVLIVVTTRFAVRPAPNVPPPSAEAAQSTWARVLERFVNECGEVDFRGLSEERADFDRYLRYVADTPLSQLDQPDERLAHMINAYNALSIFNVIESGFPGSHAGWRKLVFFVFWKLPVDGRTLSLYHFENDIIRPFTRSLNDPRVHFALNCSAVACPELPRTPFTADSLDRQLERETRAFFARPENYRIDHKNRVVWLSEILKFYTEDFVPEAAPSLIAYVNRYAPTTAPKDFRVRFTPYDWTIARWAK